MPIRHGYKPRTSWFRLFRRVVEFICAAAQVDPEPHVIELVHGIRPEAMYWLYFLDGTDPKGIMSH